MIGNALNRLLFPLLPGVILDFGLVLESQLLGLLISPHSFSSFFLEIGDYFIIIITIILLLRAIFSWGAMIHDSIKLSN